MEYQMSVEKFIRKGLIMFRNFNKLLFLSLGLPFVLNSAAKTEADWQLINGAEDGNHKLVQEALKNGANVNARGEYGTAALHYACMFNHFEIVKTLIACNAKIDIQACEGYAPLHVSKDHSEIIKALIDAKADINVRDWGHNTPILLASFKGEVLKVKQLLEYGADYSLTNKEGEGILDLAKKKYNVVKDNYCKEKIIEAIKLHEEKMRPEVVELIKSLQITLNPLAKLIGEYYA